MGYSRRLLLLRNYCRIVRRFGPLFPPLDALSSCWVVVEVVVVDDEEEGDVVKEALSFRAGGVYYGGPLCWGGGPCLRNRES